MELAAYFTHLALVVMVMDLCVNRGIEDAADIKGERAKSALQSFEDVRDFPLLFDRFLNSLCDILRKYKVHLTNSSALALTVLLAFSARLSRTLSTLLSITKIQSTQLGMHVQELGGTLDSSFNASFDAFFDEFWGDCIPKSIKSRSTRP